jgi:hypothetical protein
MKQSNYNKVRRTAFFASAITMMVLSHEVNAQWFLNGNNLLGPTSMGSK